MSRAAPSPTLLLVTPYLADANNGNWRTAIRWAQLLAPAWRTILQSADQPVTGGRCDAATLMIALHARRSRAAIAAWKRAHPERALLVVLTGTDLYRDVPAGDADALASMRDADRIVVLQEDAARHVPPAVRAKVRVVYQSARRLTPFAHKSATALHCLLVAHLRAEKDPRTALDAWRALPPDVGATLTIVGAPLDASLAEAARALADADRRVRYLGARPHAWVRQAIKRAHLLVVPSRMEGGANVVVEAVTAGTPVLGSRMSGNVGMLGADYPGLFDVGDVTGLAALVMRAKRDRGFLAALQSRCESLAPRFLPQAERAALCGALSGIVATAAVQ
jgi:putative glycosyltransferase (TIGR04348 family)